jgi:sec-independent protein translocase protein TatA
MSIWHWLIVLVVVLLLFGAGKIPKLMGDMAKGVTAFKKGLKDAEDELKSPTDDANATPQQVTGGTAATATAAATPAGEVKKDAKV